MPARGAWHAVRIGARFALALPRHGRSHPRHDNARTTTYCDLVVTQTQRRNVDNLPAEVTSLVGRRRELSEVEALLGSARLVTLTGVGGVGKSRLALRVAARKLRAFRDGVWLVELAAVREPDLVAHTVAEALRLGEQSGRPPLAMLIDFVRDRQLFLVLDNCEHLPQACAVLVDTLLRAAPGLKVLATSRQSLGVGGEHVWRVPPLQAPDLDGPLAGRPGSFTAIELFIDRAVAARTGFAVTPDNQGDVVRLCRLLDGIPLGIELAAVWLRSLSMAQLMFRLDDRFGLLTGGRSAVSPRHQTLRAAVDWSYELCSPAEKVLWARVSVFAGGLDLAAAEVVCAGTEIGVGEVVVGLDGLVDKSVLLCEEHGGRVRFRLLETLREYGQERLREAGEEGVVRRRHRDYYARMAERLDADWYGPDQLNWFDRLRAEHANLRAALEYCLTQPGEARAGLAMAANLWFYWIGGGQLREGRYWLDRALAADTEPCRQRAGALAVNGFVIVFQGDVDAAVAMLEHSRDLARQLGDENTTTRATLALCVALFHHGDLPRAAALLHHAAAGFEALPVPDSMAPIVGLTQAQLAALAVDPVAGIDMCAQVCRSSQSVGELWVSSWATHALANALWLVGRQPEATIHARECLRAKVRFADALGISVTVELLAWIAAAAHEFERAAVLLGASLAIFEHFGLPALSSQHRAGPHEAAEEQARAALGDAQFATAFNRGAAASLDEAIAFALGQQPAQTEPAPSPSTAAADQPANLTPREREVAELVAQGLSNKQIGATLVIAQRTAEAHIEHILTKLGYTCRAQIAAWITAQR